MAPCTKPIKRMETLGNLKITPSGRLTTKPTWAERKAHQGRK